MLLKCKIDSKIAKVFKREFCLDTLFSCMCFRSKSTSARSAQVWDTLDDIQILSSQQNKTKSATARK